MEIIAVFDFDGTIIKRDSMLLFFLRYFNLSFKSIKNMLYLIIESIKFFLKISTQKQYKERFINLIINSSKIKDFNKLADDFSEYLIKKIYSDAKQKIIELKKSNYELVLLSASPDFYLKRIKDKLGFSKLICTRTNFKYGKIIITSKNCYGKDKVEMFLDEYRTKKINWKKSYCFSDNKSDRNLLRYFSQAYIINNKRLKKNNPDFNLLIWK